MSCERNRGQYFQLAASAGSPVAQAFGSREEGAAALEDLFAVGRTSTAGAVPAPLAEAQTRLLFAQMQAAGISPPTHSTSGLPRPDAQQGYALAGMLDRASLRTHALAQEALWKERQRIVQHMNCIG